jgi:hypothetical protein
MAAPGDLVRALFTARVRPSTSNRQHDALLSAGFILDGADSAVRVTPPMQLTRMVDKDGTIMYFVETGPPGKRTIVLSAAMSEGKVGFGEFQMGAWEKELDEWFTQVRGARQRRLTSGAAA